jgi:hypothetical protein
MMWLSASVEEMWRAGLPDWENAMGKSELIGLIGAAESLRLDF